ncbi:hypothetical protein AKJ09_01452 [Labilithrix luteola]|uniref:Lipoprotein n=1 Tax=Labilithrix luteola TaxID=1391654 RepID=A0A0K1PMN8_9BACT|nr:VCBS repeat-containing protein [Labilithrix luteola]AKU94788.1 hypothetical protein AKJ09_01452 [Labilithrix luteola]
MPSAFLRPLRSPFLVVFTVLAGTFALPACAAQTETEEVGAGEGAIGADAYAAYVDFVNAEGGSVRSGEVTVLGLRGVDFDGNHHPTRFAHAFDDTFVVLKADKTVERFHGSTHPFEVTGVAGVPDVDGDGQPDIGLIRPGSYKVQARAKKVANVASYLVTTDGKNSIPSWRDTNHDGIIDEQEKEASEARATASTDILFHQGEGGAPPAVGCQVLSAVEMPKFIRAVGGAGANFRYVLVDVTDRNVADLPR